MNIARIAKVVSTGLRSPCLTGTFILESSNTSHSLSACACKVVRLCHNKPNKRKSLYKTKEAKKVRFYIVEKYLEYLKKLEDSLEKRFPAAMRVYKQFMEGVGLFIKDTKDYFRIIRLLNTEKSFSDLSRKEMELYDQMPRDMKRVGPVLIIASIPFGTSILPLVYMFPRYLLCSHFWSLQQKADFQTLDLKYRLSHNRPIFRHLQSQLNFLKCHCLYEPWNDIIGILGSGLQPPVNEIVKCKTLFMTEPYHLLYLSRNHVINLCKIHEMTVGFFFRRSRLVERAFILKEMDKAIIKEGGVENLPVDALRKCCYIRGLNPVNLKNEEMIKYLTDWIKLSSHVNKDSYSLLLHAPILLGYNLPSNWKLIYENNKQ